MSEIDLYLSLPWTIRRSVRNDDGRYFALTIDELTGFVVAGRTYEELDREFWPALSAFIQSYLDDGEEPPLPAGFRERLSEVRDAVGESAPPRVAASRQRLKVGKGVTGGPGGVVTEGHRELARVD